MDTSNIADLWTLSDGTTTVSAAGMGVTEIIRRRAAQGDETCLLRMDGTAFDAAPRFDHGSTVRVLRGGVPWFVGCVTGTPGTGEAEGEGMAYQLSGPWWHLERLACQQEWTLLGGEGTGLLGRIILGQAWNGERLHSGEVVLEALQYAVDAGAPFQIGVVEPQAILPLEEVCNLTCAEVVRRVLRWHPDCVAWFDHATEPLPTFHCRKRVSLPQVTFTVGQAPLAAVRGITARPDLLAPAVVLRYETTAGDGGLNILTDIAPEEATGQEPGTLVATIPVRASSSSGETGVVGEEATFSNVEQLPMRGEVSGTTLARALYEARSALQYSGSVILVEREAGGTAAALGTALNLAGAARAEWAGMRAPVTEEETYVASGTTILRFGPAAGTKAQIPGADDPGSLAAVETRNSASRVSGQR